jgi:hypothetical protein
MPTASPAPYSQMGSTIAETVRSNETRSTEGRRRGLASGVLGEAEVSISRLIALAEAQQQSIWEKAHGLTLLRRAEKLRAATPASKTMHELHWARTLPLTGEVTCALLWMQQSLHGCTRLKRQVVSRLECAWAFAGREGIPVHLLDVLESRISRVDTDAMQRCIEVEEGWLLGKAKPPTRTGGGYQRSKSGTLLQETEWLHNLEKRHLTGGRKKSSTVVPPPVAHGLRVGEDRASRARTPLWPDASASPSAPPGASYEPARWPDSRM